ncbi:MAG: exodeoxyribonuclease VII large subunit, partial [Luteolibacter sp.]
VADGAEVSARLAQLRRRMQRVVRERVTRSQMAVDSLKRGPLQRDGEKLLRESVMRVDSARALLTRSARSAIEALEARLNELRSRHKSHHPALVLERRMEAVANLRQRFERAGKENLASRAEQLGRLRGLLRALGPESAFQRGFSISIGPDGKIVTSALTLKPGETLRTKFADGETTSVVRASNS